MRRLRLTLIGMLLGLTALGAWLGLAAQDRHTPWPPAPVRPPQAAVNVPIATASSAPVETNVGHAREATTTARSLSPIVMSSAEILVEASSEEARSAAKPGPGEPSEELAPSSPGAGARAKPRSAAPGTLPVLEPETLKPGSPSAPTDVEPLPLLVETPMPELIPHLPQKATAPKPQAETPPAPPVVAPSETKSSQPLAGTPVKLPMIHNHKPAPPRNQETPPTAPVPAAKPMLPRDGNPSALTPPEVKVAAPPLPMPDLPLLPDLSKPTTAGPLSPKNPTSSEPPLAQPMAQPMAPAPRVAEPPPRKPPAFMLVKPRRLDTPPAATPSQPTPTAITPTPITPTPITPIPQVTPSPMTPAPAPARLDKSQDRLLASSVPTITVDKSGPSALKQGRPASYWIVVRNLGSQRSGPVRVEDEIPAVAQFQRGEPAPTQLGDKVIWSLPPLEAGAEKTLQLELLAIGSGEFVSNTTVYVSAATASTRARINEAPAHAEPPRATTSGSNRDLGVRVSNPPTVALQQKIVFEAQVTNLGKQALANLVLYVKLDPGFTHPAGQEIEADVGELEPGASRVFSIPVTAARTGRHNVEVRISTADGVEAAARGSATVTAAGGLSLQLPPATRLWLDRDGELRIDVVNHGAAPARNVQVSSVLPDHVDYLSASDRGIYQAAARTVQWFLDFVPPGQTRTVAVRVHARKPGELSQDVAARAEALPETRAQGLVQVEAVSNLTVMLTPRDSPLEVGRETIYEVRVQNHGNAAATNVQVRLELPPGFVPGYAQGPTTPRPQGRTVSFDAVAQLPARSQAVFHVGATAQSPGDWRVRVHVTSDQHRQPLTREAATLTYRE